MSDNELRGIVKEVLQDELLGLLNDVGYRINTLYNLEDRVNARDLDLASHQLDGYAVSDNTPTASSIAWTDCNIVYKGTNYAITNGNTANKFVYWQFTATDKTKFQTSNTKPTLTDDDVLVFINDNGTHYTQIGSGSMTHGATLVGGTIGSSEIGSKTILAANIANGAATADIIASGAVTSGKIGSGAVGTTALANTAVTEGKLANSAVTASKVADGAIGSAKIADSAVNADKLASGAVTSGKIGSGAVTSGAIGAGAVSTEKLNTALHMIF